MKKQKIALNRYAEDNRRSQIQANTPMKNLPQSLAALALTAWIGSLWAIGYLAVPTLFYGQENRQLAGLLAGQMFEKLGYLSLLCGGYLLTLNYLQTGKAAFRQTAFQVIAAMLFITMLMQFYIQPLMAEMKQLALPLDVMQSLYAQDFRMWHGISSVLYLAQSLLGALLVVRFYRISSTTT